MSNSPPSAFSLHFSLLFLVPFPPTTTFSNSSLLPLRVTLPAASHQVPEGRSHGHLAAPCALPRRAPGPPPRLHRGWPSAKCPRPAKFHPGNAGLFSLAGKHLGVIFEFVVFGMVRDVLRGKGQVRRNGG
ncbi:hypothetical protein E2C01_060478 [Portunus trituberculatus]|uniref:Uncharacterized protein n=1 Tax=Portunus trituberculatus TaxID=210409 RepID=A0A5B7H196_PORTR|nr:hypothetical protein [Portunus trituberculatus]